MQHIIVDGSNAVVHGPASWSAFSFGRRIAELLAEIPDCPVGSVALSNDAPAEALSWEGCPLRILPCTTSGNDYDPYTQTLGEPAVTVAEDGQSASATYSPTDKPVDEVAAWAVARINREAGEQRAAHITTTVGQEGTYVAKQQEVERHAAGDDGPYPYLDAEAAATGSTRAEVAALVSATAAAWTAINAGIEGRRRGALVATEAARQAGDVAAIRALFPISWPE